MFNQENFTQAPPVVPVTNMRYGPSICTCVHTTGFTSDSSGGSQQQPQMSYHRSKHYSTRDGTESQIKKGS